MKLYKILAKVTARTMTHISACTNTYFGSERQQKILIDCYMLDQCIRMTISSPKPHTVFYCFSSLTLADLSSSPKWTSDQQGSWFQNTEREKMCKLREVLHKLQLAKLTEIAAHQLTSSHLIQHAVSCEEMCLSINSLYWLQEVKLFP